MDNDFSVFDLERRKWELSQDRSDESRTRPGKRSGQGGNTSLGPLSGRESLPTFDEPAESLAGLHDSLLGVADGIRDAVKGGQPPDIKPALALVRTLIDKDYIDRVYEFASTRSARQDLPAQTAYTSLAALKIGGGLAYSKRRLLYLGVAALFENVGLYRSPDRLHQHENTLSPQDRAKIRTLPHFSAQIIGRIDGDLEWLQEVVLQVNERIDGSGFPNGLKGKQVSEFASILGLVKRCMSKRRKMRFGNVFLQTQAIKEVVDEEKSKFPRRVLKELLNQISLFPVNTYVRLNNDSIGRVLSTYKSQPMRPSIELLYDGLGKKKDTPKLVHLSSFPLLHISDALSDLDFPMDQATGQGRQSEQEGGL